MEHFPPENFIDLPRDDGSLVDACVCARRCSRARSCNAEPATGFPTVCAWFPERRGEDGELLLPLAGACLIECSVDRDCPEDWICIPTEEFVGFRLLQTPPGRIPVEFPQACVYTGPL
ncbi:MAG: hypothetical protein AAGF12_00125 [Myxococcota bacterium]